MEYRRLGKTGVKVSVLSYGSWVSFGVQNGISHVKDLMSAGRDAGINFWDTAEGYSQGEAETLMGQAFKELGWKRSDHVVSTKIFWGGQGPNDTGLSRKHIVEGVKASLSRLQMDYVDLLFCHCPDPNTPVVETVRAMNHVIDQGWALYWGTSTWSAEQIQEAITVAERLDLIPPHFEQPEYNMFNRHKVEVEFADLYDAPEGLGLTTWSPLNMGILTGKYSGGKVPPDSRFALEHDKGLWKQRLSAADQLAKVDALKPIADELGCSLAQLAIAWCAANPRVSSVITGASKVEQVRENMKALDVLKKLDQGLLDRIEAVVQTKP